MNYFAYGSNMSIVRLQKRVPNVKRLGTYILKRHILRFHKASKDGSGKCDAFQTNNKADMVIGALFEINEDEKAYLDTIEGLGFGYNEKSIIVHNDAGEAIEAVMYYATDIDSSLKPYAWYLNHVVMGAIEINVPVQYLDSIQTIEYIEDLDKNRNANERAIYN
jgi:gamma-glutamylcyclotransferase